MAAFESLRNMREGEVRREKIRNASKGGGQWTKRREGGDSENGEKRVGMA